MATSLELHLETSHVARASYLVRALRKVTMSHGTSLPQRTSAPGPAVPQCQLLLCSAFSFLSCGLTCNIHGHKAGMSTTIAPTIATDIECTPNELRPPCLMGTSLFSHLKRNDHTGFRRRPSFPSVLFTWEKISGCAYCEGPALPYSLPFIPHSSPLHWSWLWNRASGQQTFWKLILPLFFSTLAFNLLLIPSHWG